jgi:hypothetical protein
VAVDRLFVLGDGLPAFPLPSVLFKLPRVVVAADIPARVPVEAVR